MQGKVAHYAFVASAGAYKANKVEPVLTESDSRKDSAGHVAVEKYLEEQVCSRFSLRLQSGTSGFPGPCLPSKQSVVCVLTLQEFRPETGKAQRRHCPDDCFHGVQRLEV